MPRIYADNKKDRPDRRAGGKKRPVVLMLVAAVVLLAALYAYFRPADLSAGLSAARRVEGAFSYYVLKGKPQFYHLLIEKNGKDMRFDEGVPLEITYRDEFIIKTVVSDDLKGKYTGATVEGIGDQGNHMGIVLKGMDFVSGIMQGDAMDMEGKASGAYKISVYYKQERIGLIPLRVIITPQDWLRFAEKFKSPEESIRSLKKVAAQNTEDTGVRRVLAGLYLKQNRAAEAAAVYEDILRLTPGDSGVIKDLARSYIHSGRMQQAVEILSGLLENGKHDADAFALLGQAYGRKNTWGKAVDYYRQALQADPGNDGLRLLLAGAYERAGRKDAAIEQYLHVVQNAPADAAAWRGLGDV